MRFSQYRVPTWCAVVVGLMLAGPAIADDEPVASNLELMGRLTDEVAREIIASVPATAGMGNVVLVPNEQTDQYTFTDNVITRVLTEAGHRVYQPQPNSPVANAPDSSGARLRFEYQAIHFELSYPKIYRPFLIGGKKVKRRAEVRLLARLVDPADQSVVWIGEATRSHEDKFSYGDLAEVEAGSFGFTKPEHSSSGLGKVVEPVVVTGIIIGLIYLFFSNQSNN